MTPIYKFVSSAVMLKSSRWQLLKKALKSAELVHEALDYRLVVWLEVSVLSIDHVPVTGVQTFEVSKVNGVNSIYAAKFCETEAEKSRKQRADLVMH